jgi:hypothetical protein
MDQGTGGGGAGHRDSVHHGPRGTRELGDSILVFTGWQEAVEPTGVDVEGRQWLELITASTGVGRRGFGEWGSMQR